MRYLSRESDERKIHRLSCPARCSVTNFRAICVEYDTSCTAKTLCPRMRKYDEEFLGITHKCSFGEDVYDNTTDGNEERERTTTLSIGHYNTMVQTIRN